MLDGQRSILKLSNLISIKSSVFLPQIKSFANRFTFNHATFHATQYAVSWNCLSEGFSEYAFVQHGSGGFGIGCYFAAFFEERLNRFVFLHSRTKSEFGQ